MQIYKLCDSNRHLPSMNVHNENRKCNSYSSRVDIICIVVISSPSLYGNLHTNKILCCGPVRRVMRQECHTIVAERNTF